MYEFCSGDTFKNNFSNITNISAYATSIFILFILEIAYHVIVDIFIIIE